MPDGPRGSLQKRRNLPIKFLDRQVGRYACGMSRSYELGWRHAAASEGSDHRFQFFDRFAFQIAFLLARQDGQ